MHPCHLDHIVITAPNLKAGVEFVRETLGVSPVAGGEHSRMGTHNRLLKLGDAAFLEVIAPNPNAPKPQRPRWFGLDAMEQNAVPRFAAWVARTTDIRSTLAGCTEPLGAIEPMSRGQLNWLISIPGDGSLPFEGIAPIVMEWITNAHPASILPDAACSLLRVEAFHPQAAKVAALLESIAFQGSVSVSPLPAGALPYLIAHIDTPGGCKQLRSPDFPLNRAREIDAPTSSLARD